MQYRRTKSFHDDYKGLTKQLQGVAKKAFKLFQENPNHPSLKIHPLKKYKREGVMSGHINDKYVFTFTVERVNGDVIYWFRRIGDHTIYNNPL